MEHLNLFTFVIISLFYRGIFARPSQLKAEKYEFQEFQPSNSEDHIASSSPNARLQEEPTYHVTTPWSQQHPNEVNAFAEMFRRNYNKMVEQHNERMKAHQQTAAKMLFPVTYELYHVPVGYTWNNYFGTKQQYIYDVTERLSRQLMYDVQQGYLTQQKLMNPNFFIEQATNELNRVHQSHEPIDFAGAKDEISYQQQQQPVFVESVNHENVNHDENTAMVYNKNMNQLEYNGHQTFSEVSAHIELAVSINKSQQSERQTQPSARINTEKVDGFDQQIDQIEVHVPIFVEKRTDRGIELIASTPNPVTYQQSIGTNNDEFYGSTYDQQSKYDLQFVERLSASTSPSTSRGHVMSLVRSRTKVNDISTSENPTTTSTTTTTSLPTTTSSIMSMLPNKRHERNYTELYQQIQTVLDNKLQQMAENKTDEMHFMGMTNNRDHAKLTYETLIDGKNEQESRGDQGIPSNDYTYDESETNTEHHSETIEYTTLSTTPVAFHTNSFYAAALAPFPSTTTTLKPPNPYYSAPLAPFPEEMLQKPNGMQYQEQVNVPQMVDMGQDVEQQSY